MTEKFISILNELLSVPSPPGREEKTRAIIEKKLRELKYAYEIDPGGNVIVRIKGKSKKGPLTIIAAHMDEIAMVVTAIEPCGDLKVTNSGGLVPCKLGETPVEIVSDKAENVIGVFSMGSAHTDTAREGRWAPGWGDVRIKTGLSTEELKAKGIRVGSPAVPTKDYRGPYVFGDSDDPMISAWTFDDRAGIAELLLVLEEMKTAEIVPDNPLIIAFTVHEEGGCHGAKSLAFREHPEIFIAIDGCPVIGEDGLKLDGCPGSWSKDRLCNYDQRLIMDFQNAAKRAGTGLQIGVYDSAASDASAVYNAGLVSRTGFLGHVRANSHGFEVARLTVFSNTVKTIIEYIKKFT
jgi:putative aminopeptidase FrvX